MQFVQGGVTAAKGFQASGVHVGLRKNQSKKDLALIYSKTECTAAAVYTRNIVKAAPLYVTQEHLADGKCKAVICNSGNANACTADGMERAKQMCSAVAQELGIQPEDCAVASTGTIGVPLDIGKIQAGIPSLVAGLTTDGEAAAEAILTTDTVKKECAVAFELDGKPVHIGGIAKGSGMIHPNMGTMLCFITTDAAISATMLQKALRTATDKSFNRVSIDGDTSTNDTALVMANGLAGNEQIAAEGPGFDIFTEALAAMCVELAKKLARDGEGATKLIACNVEGAGSESDANALAKSVIASSLVKSAMFGKDANWGRVLCALGYAGVAFDPLKVNVDIVSSGGRITMCKDGAGVAFDEDKALAVLEPDVVTIEVDMQSGGAQGCAWGCDLTYDYVKINGSYRT